MAKNEKTVKDSEEVAARQSTDMVAGDRPDFMTGNEGTEHITNADIQIPRIVLAQKMSDEVDASHAKYIEGLKPGDMFNGLSHEIYGRGPINFVILRADEPRFVEFFPRSEGGGVKDPNVPANDPRTKFGENGEKPTATKFYDFVILTMPFKENPADTMAVLSFKSTGLKIAKQLNALIKLRNAPVYGGIYSLSSVDTQNSKGKFAIFNVTNAGWIRDKSLYDQLADMSHGLAKEDLTKRVQRADEPDADEFPFGENSGGTGNVGSM